MQTYKEFKKHPKAKKICQEFCIESEIDYIAWQYETTALYKEQEAYGTDSVSALAGMLGLELNELEDIIF